MFLCSHVWLSQEILEYWTELEADRSVPRDFTGRAAGQELRLDIPTKHLALADRSSFHTKLVEQSTKSEKGLDEADIEAYRRETQMGHLRSDDLHFAQHGCSSKALDPGVTGRNPFSAALPMYAAGYRLPCAGSGASPSKTPDGGKAGLLEEGSTKAEVVALDPELARTEAFAACSSRIKVYAAKLEDALRESAVALARRDLSKDDEDHSGILRSRCRGACALLGFADVPTVKDPEGKDGLELPLLHKDASPQDKKDWKKDYTTWHEEAKARAVLAKVGADVDHAEVVAAWLKGLGGVNPVTKPEFLKAVPVAINEVNLIKQLTTEDAVKTASSQVDECIAMWEEFHVNTVRILRALTSKINKRKADVDRAAQVKSKRQKTEAADAQRAVVAVANAKLVKAEAMPMIFMLDAGKEGVQPAVTCPSLDHRI